MLSLFGESTRMFIQFRSDVSEDQIIAVLEKLGIEGPVVKICRTMIIEENDGDFRLKRKGPGLEERVRRLEERL